MLHSSFSADVAPQNALCGENNRKRSKHPSWQLKRKFRAVSGALDFRYPDFSLGQAERPAVRLAATRPELTGSSPNPLYCERRVRKNERKKTA